jgi:hypothetical protein
MVARMEPHARLIVTFHREGEEPETMLAHDGQHARAHAIALIAECEGLQHGDTLTVRGTEPGDELIVEVLRRPYGEGEL